MSTAIVLEPDVPADAASDRESDRAARAPHKVPEIASLDMMTLLYAELDRKGIAGHHIDSYNSFARVGIKQIVTKVFTIEDRLRNYRDKTEEDREIQDITYKIEFTDINLTPPTYVKYGTGRPATLTPQLAREQGLNYSATMYIDARCTATAHYRNNTSAQRVVEIRNHRIAQIPCLVGSELCHTSTMARATRKMLHEDPRDPGGYFILKGTEWAIDSLENITNNSFHVFRNAYRDEIARGQFLSKPGDAFENSYQVILRYLQSGAITVETTTAKYGKFELPFYMLFRVMGMARDVDMIDHIVYGYDTPDAVTANLLEILERALAVDAGKFEPIRRNTVPAEIAQFVGQKIAEANITAMRKDDNVVKYLNSILYTTIDRYIFPHIGTDSTHRVRKLRFLGHLINRLLCVNLGVIAPTDRDSFRNKRIYSAGTSLAKSFKTDFNFTIVQPIKKQLRKDFKSTPFSQIALAESIKTAINSDDLERMLIQAISTGNKTITVKRNEITNRVSSQSVYHKNDLNVKSILNTINKPNTSSSKQTARADEMRRFHPTAIGYVDPSQSPESGESVGMKNQFAVSASVCSGSSSSILKRLVSADADVTPLDDIQPREIRTRKLVKVFINGDWTGCCVSAHETARKYRMMRREDRVHYLTTIVVEERVRELYFWVDVGRLARPLLIVYNNLTEYIASRRAPRTNSTLPVAFKQWILLTPEHINGLRAGTTTMDDLRRAGVIEYIAPEEQENAYLAPSIDVLRADACNVTRQYTHCDIPQAIFGIVTLASPGVNHSNAMRNTMYTCHRKQSVGWFALNYPYRLDKNTTLQHYCERPLLSTFSNQFTYPNGANCIVALHLFGGKNQEDSIEANSNSIDCGMFNASYYLLERAELDKGEQFGNSDYAHTMDIKKNASYEQIGDGGLVRRGALVTKNTALIVKAAKIPKPATEYTHVDKSVIYKRDEPVRVEKVLLTRDVEDNQVAKVKLRADRPLGVGDKLSSFTGNKGIVAGLLGRFDMPFTDKGLVIDLLVNAHSIPTRMAINQLIECATAQLAASRGVSYDASAFNSVDLDGILDELARAGVQYGGHQRVYNGRTGCYIDTLIFCGPTGYQRLQKYVIDDHYAIRTGPTSALTRQPLDGKNADGGLRVGEMEKDVMVAHGTMRATTEKLYADSDGADMYICARCGKRAIVNEQIGLYKCKICGDLADIARVPSAWVANLFFNESSSMNADMCKHITPPQYSVYAGGATASATAHATAHDLPTRADALSAKTGSYAHTRHDYLRHFV